ERATSLRLRYLGDGNQWHDAWPPRDIAAETLPRAVEWRLLVEDFGELRRIVILSSGLPMRAAEAAAETGIPTTPLTIGVP
ncbi:MAG TPA: type II secretion system protein GspJ, partial [Dokdonella sp.]|nr:type II secretion system protein GspJ [Dokdonella sp.]